MLLSKNIRASLPIRLNIFAVSVDPSVLSETREVMKTIPGFVQSVDAVHYSGMVNFLAPAGED